MKAKALLIICTSLILEGLLINHNANADSPSLWVNQGQPTKTLLQTNVTSNTDDKFCNYHTEYEIQYKWSPYGWSGIFEKLLPVEGCWQEIDEGAFSNYRKQYMRLEKSGPVARIDNPRYDSLYALGKTNKIAGIYRNGYNGYLYIIENIREAYDLVHYWTYDKYVLRSDADKWSLNDSETGQAIRIENIGISENGWWIVAVTNNGFMRINTITKQVTVFEKQLYAYGQGLDPIYELSVSDDGRYAVISGGNVVDRSNLLYDLSTCVVPSDKPMQLATGCGKRDIKADFLPTLAANQAGNRLMFSHDSTSIMIDLPVINKWDRYILTAPGQDYHGLSYLALGDSYTSGEGKYASENYVRGTDGDGENVPEFQTNIANYPYFLEKCHLTENSYPYLLAAEASLTRNNFHSIACSGSTTADVLNISSQGRESRYNGKFSQMHSISLDGDVEIIKNNSKNNFIPGRAAQIEFVSKYRPKVVTLGIGGNDINFRDKLVDCLGMGTCSYATDLRYITGKEIHDLYDKLVSTYRQLQTASPTTKYYITGYPQIIANDSFCAPNVRLNADERYFAQQTVSYLNATIQAAADTVGFTFLDTEQSLQGKMLCDQSFDGKAVQGVVLGNDQYYTNTLPVPPYTTSIGFGNESFHPTYIGHEMIARAISTTLGTSTIMSHRPCAPLQSVICPKQASAVDIPQYFLPNPMTDEQVRQIQLNYENSISVDKVFAYPQGATIPTSNSRDYLGDPVSDLLPSSSVAVDIYSTKQALAPLTVDAKGSLTGIITLPTNLEPGYHTVVLHATNNLHQSVALYQQIVVYATINDLDGDGVANTEDKCEFISPVGIDADHDGIDDGCDGIIYQEPDTSAPVVTAQLERQPNEKGWYKDKVTIHWAVSDNVDKNITVPADIIVDQEGEHTYTSAQVCDTSNNCATGSVGVKLDMTAPTVTATMDSQPNEKGWHNRPVTVSWQVVDAITSLSAPDAISVTQEGEHSYTSDQVCDDAGNCATGSVVVRLDMTAPTVTPSFDRAPNSEGWHNSPVRIDWRIADNLDHSISQLASIIADKQGEYTYTTPPRCDVAGNCASGSQSIKLDSVTPTVGELVWTANPKKTTEQSDLSVNLPDDTSGVRRAEYFIGDTDPGAGNAATMHYDGAAARVTHGTDYPAGVYNISVRAQDAAGNWSQLRSGYLVVYDPALDMRVRGKKTIMLTPAMNLPWVTNDTLATFGLSAQYGRDKTITKQSDFQFAYRAGTDCKHSIHCHTVEINSTAINWLVYDGLNQSRATLQATAIVTIDGRKEPARLLIEAIDGTRVDQTSNDTLLVRVDRTADLFAVPVSLVIGPVNVERGNIKINR